jgi:cytochrome c2
LFTSEAKPPCATCHTIEGIATGQIGPELTHIASMAADRIKEPAYGGSATDAASYIRESILTPNAFIASDCPTGACFKGIMPQDFGTKLSEQQITDLVAFLLELP